MGSRRFELDDLYSVRIPSDPQLSPDATRVALVLTQADRERDANLSDLWSVPADGGPMVRLTESGNASSPRWSPDGDTIAFLSSPTNGEPPQIWLLEGGEPRQLTDLAGGAGTPVWSPSGDRLAFAQKPRLSSDYSDPIEIDRLGYREDGVGLRPTIGDHLYVMDAVTGDSDLLVDGAGFIAPMVDFASTPVWSPDGSSIANSWSPRGDELPYTFVTYTIDVDTLEIRPITDAEGFLLIQDWSPDGEHLLVWGQERYVGERAHTGLYLAPAAGGQLRPLATSPDRTIIAGSRFAAHGSRAVLAMNDRGAFPLMTVPVDGGSDPEPLIAGSSTVWQFSTASHRVAAVVLDPTTCGEVESVFVEGTGRRRLTDLFASALPDVRLFEPQERTFRATDGEVVHGWVLLPDGEGPTPGVLSIHGGPHMAWGPVFDQFHPYQQVLAARGWTVLMVNPRGSDGYGESYLRGGSWGEHDDGDLLAALDALIAEGQVDAERVAVTGYSYGGYMTCLITALHDRFTAAVAGGVITDLPSSMWSSDLGLFGILEHDSDPWTNPELWRERSPITHVDGVRCPTLILHGEADDRCPFNQAEAWFLALRQRGVPVRLVRYPGASHSFQWEGRPSYRIDYCRRIVDWFDEHVSSGGPASIDDLGGAGDHRGGVGA